MGEKEDVTSFWEKYSHRSVIGVGKIICQHGKEHKCIIHIWQLKNGRMVVAINSNSELNCSSNNYRFIGKLQDNASTYENWHMEIMGIQLFVDYLSINTDGHDNLGFIDETVSIFNADKVQSSYKIIVSELTNFSLNFSPSSFDLGEYTIKFTSRSGENFYIARSLRSSAILGELKISSQNQLTDEQWDDVIDRLCQILSLSQRSYVAKVSKFRFNDTDGLKDNYVLYGLMGIQATKASRQFLISAENVPSYLKVAFYKLPQVYQQWNLGTALDHYLQAINRESAWAIGVGLVVALECLVSAYSNKDNNREYYFGDMEEFKPSISVLANQAMEQLEKVFPETAVRLKSNRDELNSWQSSFMNLNRRSFGRKIRSMLDELGIKQPNSDVLRRYIDLRNDLVHNGYPVTSKDFVDDFRSIMEMADFLENILLSILGYQGVAIGWDNYLV